MSLRAKTISSLIWTFSQQFSVQLISFFITIVLARILLPAQFGQIAMLTVFIAVGNLLIDGGLSSSLIRTKHASQKDYSTVFYFNLAGSLVLYLLTFLLAPFIADFYHQEILTQVIRFYAITFVFNAFYEIQNAHLVKTMNFKKQTFIQIPAIIISGLVGVVFAKLGYGVWSLVWMNVIQSFLVAVLHWIKSDWKPSLIFDKDSFKEHFHFGYKMTLSGLLEIIYKNIYVLIIGKNYSATQLGYYSRAESISRLPSENITIAINKVTYPMFASISSDNLKLKEVYKKLMQQVIFWNAPVLILLCIVAEPLFSFLITDKWLPAVPYFKILCLSNIFYPLHAYNLNILKVKGRSDLVLKLEFIKKGISICAIIAILPFGIYGLLFFQLIFTFIAFYINSYYSGKLISYSIKEQLFDISPSFVLAVLVGSVIYYLDAFLSDFQLIDIIRISIDSASYMCLYLAFSHVMQFNAIIDFKHLILRK